MRRRRVETDSLHGQIWTSTFDEEFVEDYLMTPPDEVDEDTMLSAIKQGNAWLYNRPSPKWNYGEKHAVEKQLAIDYPEKYESRRLAFVRHVLSTVAYRYPRLVEELINED